MQLSILIHAPFFSDSSPTSRWRECWSSLCALLELRKPGEFLPGLFARPPLQCSLTGTAIFSLLLPLLGEEIIEGS